MLESAPDPGLRRRQIEAQLQLLPRALVGFSSEEGFGRDEIWSKILEAAHAT